jgi:DNA-binding IclR family transcriptional regulator
VIAFKDAHTIDEISAKTGIPRSSVYRILQTLVKEDMVIAIPRQGFRISLKFASIGFSGMGQKTLLEVAIPLMRRLSVNTHEAVFLQVISGNKRVCLCRFDGDYPISWRLKVGESGLLFIGSAGKVLGAGLSDKDVERITEEYIKEGKIAKEEKASILEEIKEVRQQGYALSIGLKPGVASIGVPIKDIMGLTQASLSLSTVIERMTEKNKKNYLDLLLKVANEIQSQII